MSDDQAATEMDESQFSVSIGQRIRSRRIELGLSQADVAEGMLSPSYVSLVESGRRQPAASALTHLAERLDVDVEYLRDGVDASVRTTARLALARAEMALREGEHHKALEEFTELINDPGLNDEQARKARLGRALACERGGDLEGAIGYLTELAEEARQMPAVQPWLETALALTRCYREVGDLDMSIQVGMEAYQAASDLGLTGTDEHVRLGATILCAYNERGDVIRSKALAAELVEAADRMGAPQTRGAAYWNASLVAEAQGDLAQALSLVDRALAMFGESDDRRNLAVLRVAYASLLLKGPQARPDAALDILSTAERDTLAYGGTVEVSDLETTRAEAFLVLGRFDEARAAVTKALKDLGEQPRLGTALAKLVLARAMRGQGNFDEGVRECAAAATMLESMGINRRAAAAWRELADLYRASGRSDEALDAYDHALRAAKVAPSASLGALFDNSEEHLVHA